MILNQTLTGQLALYIKKLYIKFHRPYLLYHNIIHVQQVVNRVNEISMYYDLTETEHFIVSGAAWFHDCGHLFGPAAGHEQRSASFMKAYLEGHDVTNNIIESIESCILATKLPNDPQSLTEKILCDADLYHLGTDDFLVTEDLVRDEFMVRNNFLPANWDERSLELLERHKFFTDYCKTLLQEGKEKNILLMKEKITGKS